MVFSEIRLNDIGHMFWVFFNVRQELLSINLTEGLSVYL